MSELKILIVDDSPTIRQFLSMTLRRLRGVELYEANDGLEALEKLKVENFSLIITDINMPLMDGFTFMANVKKDPLKKDIPVIVLTTEGKAKDIERSKEMGATTYLTKPINTQRLILTIREVLKIT